MNEHVRRHVARLVEERKVEERQSAYFRRSCIAKSIKRVVGNGRVAQRVHIGRVLALAFDKNAAAICCGEWALRRQALDDLFDHLRVVASRLIGFGQPRVDLVQFDGYARSVAVAEHVLGRARSRTKKLSFSFVCIK